MINHIVMMNLNEQKDPDLGKELQSYANRIREEISEVRHYEIVPNIANGDNGFNWAIISKFDSEEAMQTYKDTPLHQAFVAYCDPLTEDLLFLDYN